MLDANIWQAKTAKNDEIITLYIELDKLNNKNLKLVQTNFIKVMGENKSK